MNSIKSSKIKIELLGAFLINGQTIFIHQLLRLYERNQKVPKLKVEQFVDVQKKDVLSHTVSLNLYTLHWGRSAFVSIDDHPLMSKNVFSGRSPSAVE